MANIVLFNSSIFMLLNTNYIFIYYSFQHRKLLFMYYIFGCLTSIWNHKVTCMNAKVIDRFVMILGYLIDIYHIHFYSYQNLILQICITCFFFSKIFVKYKTLLHLFSHLFVTLLHSLILMN